MASELTEDNTKLMNEIELNTEERNALRIQNSELNQILKAKEIHQNELIGQAGEKHRQSYLNLLNVVQVLFYFIFIFIYLFFFSKKNLNTFQKIANTFLINLITFQKKNLSSNNNN